MVERRIIMNNKVENFEWHSLLDLSGKGLHKFNAVGKDMTCSQLMNNAGLDWNVEMKEVHFQDNKETISLLISFCVVIYILSVNIPITWEQIKSKCLLSSRLKKI